MLPPSTPLGYLDAMLEMWKKAWNDAVENFRRELDPDRYDPATDRRTSSMRRDVAKVQGTIQRLENDLGATRRDLAHELDQAERCRRHEGLARQIDDAETARIAAEYAARHAERAAILEQKLTALTAERDLLRRDLETMRAALAEIGPDHHANSIPDYEETSATAAEFERLEEEARERAAEARLEELKRKMR